MPVERVTQGARKERILMNNAPHVAVIGAGIIGLAHAWAAARQGNRVTVFERGGRAQEATIRNFGMIWPIGQPAGQPFEVALRSRALWLELAQAAGIWVHECGSLHLAHRADEWRVLEEFKGSSHPAARDCRLLTAEETMQRTPAAQREGLLGALLSGTELAVNPRTAAARIADWLRVMQGVRFEWSTTIVHADERRIVAADGRAWPIDRTVICSGSDFETLFPHILNEAGLRRCKLQMLKTAPQPADWRLGPHLASGLTLRHYGSFAHCPGLAELKARIAAETPELDHYGIHVMAAQNDRGEVILGDSHEYDERIEPFQKSDIDDLMLRELRKIINLPEWTLTERWSGEYAKHPEAPFFHAQPLENVDVFTGVGGAGMTLSLGLAERFWRSPWSTVP
jgi:D-hydroxyproline dehydrogenase subunit beta